MKADLAVLISVKKCSDAISAVDGFASCVTRYFFMPVCDPKVACLEEAMVATLIKQICNLRILINSVELVTAAQSCFHPTVKSNLLNCFVFSLENLNPIQLKWRHPCNCRICNYRVCNCRICNCRMGESQVFIESVFPREFLIAMFALVLNLQMHSLNVPIQMCFIRKLESTLGARPTNLEKEEEEMRLQTLTNC